MTDGMTGTRAVRAGMLALGALLALGCGEAGSYESAPPMGTDRGGSSSSDGTGSSGGAFAGEAGGPSTGGGGGSGGDGGGEPDPVPAGQLTAGEWRDLDHWDAWLDLIGDEEWAPLAESWGWETTGRVPVRVTSGGAPLANARVALVDGEGRTEWEARTDVRGEAELFAGVFEGAEGPWRVEARAGEARAVATDVATDGTPVEVALEGAPAARRALELMFVIDTTGSMGDEIRYIQAELGDVIARAREQAAQRFDLRVSLNYYRDRGDEYVVRSNPFTADVSSALDDLAAQGAGGGGDFPEAVDQALMDAIADHEWRDDASAKLCFLVLDAPPHQEQAILARLRDANRMLAAEGVRVVPLTGSGIDKATEFLMRFLAITTGGTYTFLTNDSGIGGDHIDPTIGEYDVELLNDLLVRLIVASVDA